METISLKEVLDRMDTKQPFQIAFITLDKKKKTGGEWIELQSAVKHTTRGSKEERSATANEHRIYRNPRHYDNATRNLRNCLSGDINKVHIRLIRRFNNKVVV